LLDILNAFVVGFLSHPSRAFRPAIALLGFLLNIVPKNGLIVKPSRSEDRLGLSSIERRYPDATTLINFGNIVIILSILSSNSNVITAYQYQSNI
jgi:hypothetical protein